MILKYNDFISKLNESLFEGSSAGLLKKIAKYPEDMLEYLDLQDQKPS